MTYDEMSEDQRRAAVEAALAGDTKDTALYPIESTIEIKPMLGDGDIEGFSVLVSARPPIALVPLTVKQARDIAGTLRKTADAVEDAQRVERAKRKVLEAGEN